MYFIDIIKSSLSNEINLFFVIIIFTLALLDLIKKKDLKSQIVSMGVLGTFVGIFIGLQDFNPENMKESINHILIGLKTAFFTSIVGMLVSILLSIVQKFSNKIVDDDKQEELLLNGILEELKEIKNNSIKRDESLKNEIILLKDNSNSNFEKTNNLLATLIEGYSNEDVVSELKQLRLVQIDTKDSNEKISKEISELRENSNKENQELINILNINFEKMNNSLDIAIEKLSKGATEEIIKALKEVIQEFNQELQTQFGENFVKLNEAVINLVSWQENYKSYIDKVENHLLLTVKSIDKSKEVLEYVASKNNEILDIYKQLENIIKTYDLQVEELNRHLQTYANLSDKSKDMFDNLKENMDKTKLEFDNLTQNIKNNNEEQKNHTIKKIDEIKGMFDNLTKFIQNKHNEEKDSFKHFIDKMEKTIKELELITNHYKNLGEEIPKALQISLENLNRGLTSITKQFQKDYENILSKHKKNVDNVSF